VVIDVDAKGGGIRKCNDFDVQAVSARRFEQSRKRLSSVLGTELKEVLRHCKHAHYGQLSS
jgi:hypothetical protein